MKPSKQNRAEISVSQHKMYSGPVPDPDSLAKYEQISPGFADRILKMAEKEQEERIVTQRQVIEAEKEFNFRELNNFKRGQIFALIAVFLIVLMCIYAFNLGYGKEARDIAIAVIASVAGIFITGRFFSKSKSTGKGQGD